VDAARLARLRRLLSGAMSFPGQGRTFLVDTGLDFLAREAAAARGSEALIVVERDLVAARRMAEALPGLSVLHAARAEPGAGDMVVMPVGRQRQALQLELARLASRLGPAGTLAIYGAGREGIHPTQALLTAHCELAAPIIRAGHRLLIAHPRADAAPDWGLFAPPPTFECETRGLRLRVAALPGLFSWDRLDEGTALLLASCRPRPADRLLDLGCGAGVVAAALLAAGQVAQATLCDSDALGLEAARTTLALNGLEGRAQVLASDTGEELAAEAYDLILTNPPRHRGFAPDRDSAAHMVEQAERLLGPGGRFYLVSRPDRGLLRVLEARFGEIERAGESKGYIVWRGVKTRSSRRAAPPEVRV
jgi:16S rRNA (guanine1207-N2)-methyltransferase